MASIYGILDKYKFLKILVEEGTDPSELEDVLKNIDGEASEKMLQYAFIVKNAESDVNGIKAEIKRLKEREKAMTNNINRMKAAMEMLLREIKGQRLKTSHFTFSFRKSTAVQIEDESLIPLDFIKTETKISKTDLSKALKNGEKIPGASLVENQSLSIR